MIEAMQNRSLEKSTSSTPQKERYSLPPTPNKSINHDMKRNTINVENQCVECNDKIQLNIAQEKSIERHHAKIAPGKMGRSLNATTHGLTATTQAMFSPEEKDKFKSIVSDLQKKYKTKNTFAQEAIHHIAAASVRLNRILFYDFVLWNRVFKDPSRTQQHFIDNAGRANLDLNAIIRYERALQSTITKNLKVLEKFQESEPDTQSNLTSVLHDFLNPDFSTLQPHISSSISGTNYNYSSITDKESIPPDNTILYQDDVHHPAPLPHSIVDPYLSHENTRDQLEKTHLKKKKYKSNLAETPYSCVTTSTDPSI